MLLTSYGYVNESNTMWSLSYKFIDMYIYTCIHAYILFHGKMSIRVVVRNKCCTVQRWSVSFQMNWKYIIIHCRRLAIWTEKSEQVTSEYSNISYSWRSWKRSWHHIYTWRIILWEVQPTKYFGHSSTSTLESNTTAVANRRLKTQNKQNTVLLRIKKQQLTDKLRD